MFLISLINYNYKFKKILIFKSMYKLTHWFYTKSIYKRIDYLYIIYIIYNKYIWVANNTNVYNKIYQKLCKISWNNFKTTVVCDNVNKFSYPIIIVRYMLSLLGTYIILLLRE